MGAKKISNTVKGPSSRIIEATQNLKLVGISWSNDPDVMIEDTQNHRTLFLKKGRLINNEIKVEAIFKDKVVLSYQGEEIELR
jgi:type II secretory pathway component PulC